MTDDTLTLLGRERTVVRVEHTNPVRPCELCGRERAASRTHEYSDRFVLFGRALKIYNRGVNHYCRYCADNPAAEMIDLPEIADRYQSWVSDSSHEHNLPDPAGSSAPALHNVKFRGANWENCEYLIEYVRSSAESPPNGVDADAVRQIVSQEGIFLSPPDYTALQWWVVKALKDASTEQERSRCYDLLWRVTDGDPSDTLDILREKEELESQADSLLVGEEDKIDE